MINNQKVLAVCASELCSEEMQGIIQSIYRYFYKHDWKIIIFSSCSNLSQHTLFDCGEASVFRLMDYDSIDAVLVFKKTIQCREPVNDIVSKAHTKNLPVIIVDNGNPEEGCMNISFSEDNAFTELTEHLIKVHKFTKISFLAGHKDNPSSERRIKLFLDTLGKHGIPFDEKKQLGYGSSYSAAIRREIDRFISDPENLPEAIVCFSDAMAVAVCEYLSERSISVPEQITVTGFGGSEQEQYSFPRLTTCRCDNDKLAEFIFEKTENFHKNDASEQEYVFPFSFDVSESCGCHTCSSRNILKSINKMYAQMSDVREYDKSLNNMASKLMTENNPDRIKKILKKHIPFDSYIVMNNDFCNEEQVQHN
ncbi:MAG: LacI family DNA-binding transcriptional regulator [Ruminococcus sp.]